MIASRPVGITVPLFADRVNRYAFVNHPPAGSGFPNGAVVIGTYVHQDNVEYRLPELRRIAANDVAAFHQQIPPVFKGRRFTAGVEVMPNGSMKHFEPWIQSVDGIPNLVFAMPGRATMGLKNTHFEDPASLMLKALSERTGLVQPTQSDRWHFAHATFQHYLAARFIIESAGTSTALLEHQLDKPGIANVIRFAASITPDAEPLLKFVMKSKWKHEADKMVVLADVLAQRLVAPDAEITKACTTLIDWLGRTLHGWTVSALGADAPVNSSETIWTMMAVGQNRLTAFVSERVQKVLRAVHRGRAGTAKAELSSRLKETRNEVLNAMASSLETEGVLTAKISSHGKKGALTASVMAA